MPDLARPGPALLLGATLIAGIALCAVLADVLAPFDPVAQIAIRLQPPSSHYLLGTDELGRDVLSRLIHGARISLYVGVVSVSIALALGGTIGVTSGFTGGWLDTLLMRAVDVAFAIPTLVLAIAINGAFGPSLRNAILAIGIVYTPTLARVSRAAALAVAQREFVVAARASGASAAWILARHVVPNALAPIIVQASLSFSTAILAEATLSFLGLGTQPPAPSWGSMLGSGRQYVMSAPWLDIFPGAAIMSAVLAFNLIGDGLRDALDPRHRYAGQ